VGPQLASLTCKILPIIPTMSTPGGRYEVTKGYPRKKWSCRRNYVTKVAVPYTDSNTFQDSDDCDPDHPEYEGTYEVNHG